MADQHTVADAGVDDRPAQGGPSVPAPAAVPKRGRASAVDRWLARLLLRGVGVPDVGVVLWDGQEVRGLAGPPPVARIVLRDRRILLRLLANPDMAFGDGYASGRIEILGDMRGLLES